MYVCRGIEKDSLSLAKTMLYWRRICVDESDLDDYDPRTSIGCRRSVCWDLGSIISERLGDAGHGQYPGSISIESSGGEFWA